MMLDMQRQYNRVSIKNIELQNKKLELEIQLLEQKLKQR